jgi:hypothetical protein
VVMLLGELRVEGLYSARTEQPKFHGELVRLRDVRRGHDEVVPRGEGEGLLRSVGPDGDERDGLRRRRSHWLPPLVSEMQLEVRWHTVLEDGDFHVATIQRQQGAAMP